MQLDERVLGLPARAIEGVVNPFRRAVFDVGPTTKRVSSPSGVASMRATARRSRFQDLALWRVFGIAAHDWFVSTPRSVRTIFRRLVDFLRQRLRTGQAEDVIDDGWPRTIPSPRAGRSGRRASERDARPRPALTDMAHEPAQMSAHFDARRGLAGAQHDRDGTRALGVIDMDRQKAALVVMGVEERELL